MFGKEWTSLCSAKPVALGMSYAEEVCRVWGVYSSTDVVKSART